MKRKSRFLLASFLSLTIMLFGVVGASADSIYGSCGGGKTMTMSVFWDGGPGPAHLYMYANPPWWYGGGPLLIGERYIYRDATNDYYYSDSMSARVPAGYTGYGYFADFPRTGWIMAGGCFN